MVTMIPSRVERREAGQLVLQGVGADRDRWEAIQALLVGDRDLRPHQGRARRGDANAGQDGICVVGDGPCDASCRLRVGRRREQQHQGQRGDDFVIRHPPWRE